MLSLIDVPILCLFAFTNLISWRTRDNASSQCERFFDSHHPTTYFLRAVLAMVTLVAVAG